MALARAIVIATTWIGWTCFLFLVPNIRGGGGLGLGWVGMHFSGWSAGLSCAGSRPLSDGFSEEYIGHTIKEWEDNG